MKEIEEQDNEIVFDLSSIDKTFTQYRLNQVLEGIVVLKRDDGVIFNIGGKSDAFIPKDDFDDFNAVKIGERFSVIITKMKNDEGLIEASRSKAESLIIGTLKAKELKLGSTFSFVVTKVIREGLMSKLGQYTIIIPNDEISSNNYKSPKSYLNKQLEGIVTSIDQEQKEIVASVKMLEERTQYNNELAFWNSIFVNKLVEGNVEKIVPFGAFVNVNGVSCLCHISDISYEKITSADEVLKLGQTYTFRVIKIDKENKKVNLSYKVLQKSPKEELIKGLKIGEKVLGEVTKILPFGAIIKLSNGVEGLLHISDATNLSGVNIYEICKLGENIEVVIKSTQPEKNRVSFELEIKR